MIGEQEAIPEMTDDALLASTFDEQAPEEHQEEPPPEQQDASQPRDEHGRFAARQAEEEAKGEKDDGGQIPGWRLREIREQRDAEAARAAAAERERDDLRRRWEESQRQQSQERPDLYTDPEAYQAFIDEQMGSRVKGVEDLVRDRIIDMTFRREHKANKEEFPKAYTELQSAISRGDPEARRIMNDADPGDALMEWYRQRSLMSEIGGDPDAYLKRKQEEWLKDPEVRKRLLAEETAAARDPGNRSTVINIPSVNRATGGGNTRPGALPVSDGDFFNDAIAGIGRR